ncbi:Hypothetical predicted protein [Paramuricea clavata]|uniref:Uncharacterized protein n=1 Tax=Paramuricea clavata TaxID=317549 RepID=A0A6S7GDF1_PARCT|nr:Hypothetical predicted protein [Paramuricea clavata]
MKNCWKVSPSNRPTFSQIWQDLHDMLADNEKSYINLQQVEDDGLQTTVKPFKVITTDDKIDA